MAKTIGPLLSKKASGKFGKVLLFRCGKFVLKQQKEKDERVSGGQNFQRNKFIDGAKVWSEILTPEQKESWNNFAKSVKNAKGYFTIPTPLGPIYVRIGEKTKWKECIETGVFNGYQYFQSCYLRFGPAGWSDYPNPPPFP